ncbi:hypothetical protein [Paracoccus sp. KR1-242]|uniref:hypothetical protein n=1 Tax=Paracoccus sp. KR1-242 TaxID=3410028 RepID=UPI003C06A24E
MPHSDKSSNVTSLAEARYQRLIGKISSDDSVNNLSCYSLGVCDHPLTAILFDLVNLQHLTGKPCTGKFCEQDVGRVLLSLNSVNSIEHSVPYISRIQGFALHRLFGLSNTLRYIILDDRRIWTEAIGTDFDRKTENDRRLDMLDGAIYAEMITYRAVPAAQDMLDGASPEAPVEITSQFALDHLMSPIPFAPMQWQLRRIAKNNIASDRKRIKDTQVVANLLSKAARLPYPLNADLKVS